MDIETKRRSRFNGTAGNVLVVAVQEQFVQVLGVNV